MPQDLVSTTPLDRMMSALRTIIREELPQLTYLGVWSYVVTGTDGSTLDLDPDTETGTAAGAAAFPLPSLTKVPIRTAVDGITVTLPLTIIGKRCIVGFVNCDPSRPVVLHIEPFSGVAPSPTAGALARCQLDQVVCGPFAGTIITGSDVVSKA